MAYIYHTKPAISRSEFGANILQSYTGISLLRWLSLEYSTLIQLLAVLY